MNCEHLPSLGNYCSICGAPHGYLHRLRERFATVGVMLPANVHAFAKRELLLFDRLALVGLAQELYALRHPAEFQVAPKQRYLDRADELESLVELGLAYEILGTNTDDAMRVELEAASEFAFSDQRRPVRQAADELPMLALQRYQALVVVATARSIGADGVEASAVLPASLNLALGKHPTAPNVVSLVIRNLPTPDDLTSLEDIRAFRSDPDARANWIRLQRWMREVGSRGMTDTALAQELEYLLEEYRRYMTLHKVKARTGTLQVLLTAGAELLEDVMKMRLGKLVSSLFSITAQRIPLLEAELSAPGRDVAYILQAQDRFR